MSDTPYEQLGEDLGALVRRHLPPVAAVSRVSTLVSPTWRQAAFRIETVDGSVWKGRRFESAEAAARVVGLERLMPASWVPALVAADGSAAIYRWTEGVSLSTVAVDGAMLRSAGALLRDVHDVVLPEWISPDLWLPGYPPHNWPGLLRERLEQLQAAGALDVSEKMRALEVATAFLPRLRPTGLVHGDLCPENLVLSTGGRLQVVDNDGLTIHVPQFDLARTWCRWPMTDPEWQLFCEGYGDRGVLDEYHACFPHWAVVVLTGVAAFRSRYALPGVDHAIARLREVLAKCE